MAINKDTNVSSLLPAGLEMQGIFIYGSVFLVFAACIIFSRSLIESSPVRSKAKELAKKRAELKGEYLSNKRAKTKKSNEKNLALMEVIVEKMNLIQANKRKEITQKLVSAGYTSKNAIIKYAFAQIVCGFGFMLLSLFKVHIDFSNPSNALLNALIPFFAFCAGVYLPPILVTNAKTKRMKDIQKGLPDALDLMMICTEAGLTLSAALDRVSKELGLAYPTLAQELAITSMEIGFLPERKTALENLAHRIDLPELRALTGILIQTEKYGTPVSQALRILAKEFREQRMLRAETKAARLPPMMTVPMIVFILPTLFIVVITPAVIGIMNSH